MFDIICAINKYRKEMNEFQIYDQIKYEIPNKDHISYTVIKSKIRQL